jgi:zinc/manganese transport system permease protein
MPISVADAQPSWDLVTDLQLLLQFHFMQNAYIAGTLIAVVAGIVGYFMALRSQSFAGHSLANAGFAGATGAALFGFPPMLGLFAAGVVAAVVIQALNLGSRQNRQSDIAVGAVLTAALALGFLFIHLAIGYITSVYDVLFGNILGINDRDIYLILGSSIIAVLIFAVIGRPLFFASVDLDVAAARGVPVRRLALGYLVLLALTIAIAVQVVGVLLIFALLVTPAAIAQHLTIRPYVSVGLAIGLALIFTWLGLAIAYFTPYPVGFWITSVAFGTYVLTLAGRFGWNMYHRVFPAKKEIPA